MGSGRWLRNNCSHYYRSRFARDLFVCLRSDISGVSIDWNEFIGELRDDGEWLFFCQNSSLGLDCSEWGLYESNDFNRQSNWLYRDK